MIPSIWILFSGPFRISSWCPGSIPRLRTTFGLQRKFHIYLKQLRTLSVSPYGSWICRHDEDTSPINNHQRDLEIHNGSHILNDDFVIDRTINIRNQFPLSRDTLLIRGLIVGISIPSSTSLLISTLYSFRDMSSLVTVTPSESALCKFQRFPPNPHRNDSKVPTRHLRAGGKRSNIITQ